MVERPESARRAALSRFGVPLRLGLVLLLVLVVLASLRSSVVEWNDVLTPSMRPTILEGDRIVVSRLAYDVRVPFVGWRAWRRGEPRHGDLVVYVDDDGRRTVKRVIGVPGDSIEVRDHAVVRNGRGLTQASATAATGPFAGYGVHREGLDDRYTVMIGPTAFGSADMAPRTVPPGEYFLMGDNRSHSADSRQTGTVPRERVVGRAVLVAFSRDPAGEPSYRPGRILLRLR